ncbi:hypothetical protein [Stetteria hydrogenophila]
MKGTLALAAALATFLSLLAPIASYYLYPREVEPLASQPPASYRLPLDAGLEAARGLRGRVAVEGEAHRPPGMPPGVVAVPGGGGRILVLLAGCWEAPGGRVYPGHALAKALEGRVVKARGLLVETRAGLVLVAVEVEVGGAVFKRAPCAGAPGAPPTSTRERRGPRG